MKVISRVSSLCTVVVLTAFIAAGNTAAGQPLFVEDFNSGLIDTNIWNVGIATAVPDNADDSPTSGTTFDSPEVTDLGSGDFAIQMGHNFTGRTWIITNLSNAFTRGNNLRCTYRTWGNDQRGGGVQQFPAVGGPNGGWYNDTVASTTNEDNSGPHWNPANLQEAVLDGFHTFWQGMYFSQAGDTTFTPNQTSTGQVLPETFKDAYAAAIDKSTALWIRIWLGDTIGGMFEWSSDGTNWTQEGTDTRGVSGGNTPTVYLGFGPVQSWIFVDDIVVENDANIVPVELSNFELE